MAATNAGQTGRPEPLPKAVVVGVGAEDGLGAALSRCYAANGRHVLVAGRSLVDAFASTVPQL
jgi:NAD(P)-dependent dehydrogenase (short-subunit alcohol dehydrogenase family)